MKYKIKKRGSHVGVVISFILFILFIFFFYIIIQPAITSEGKRNLFDYLKGQATYLFSANITEVSIIISKPNPQNCVELPDFFDKINVGDRFIVRNDSEKFTSEKSVNNLRINRDGSLFFRVYGSEEFDIGADTISECESLVEGSEYTIGLVKKDKNIFETKIIEFFEDYEINYENVKKRLKIPVENEFGIDFVYANGTTISAQNEQVQAPTSTVNIYVDETPIQYISRNAAKEIGTFRIRIW